MRLGITIILAGILLGTIGCAAPQAAAGVAAAPGVAAAGGVAGVPGVAAAPVPNIFGFLGIEALATKLTPIVDHKIAHLATLFPFLAPKPLLKTLGAPGNAESPSPAISAAAGVVEAEGQADQKIAALKALAKIGCGGYPEVEEAFLASLGDPTEAVRYEAVQAIRYAAGDPCETCSGSSCCTEEILKQLDKMANELTKNSCPFEPSARVRRAARLALTTCGPPPPKPEPTPGPEEGPPAELLSPIEDSTAAAKGNLDEQSLTALAAKARGVVTASAETIAGNAVQTPPKLLPTAAVEPLGFAKLIGRGVSQTQAVRWERIFVSVEDFKSYDQALALIMAIRRRALGQSADLPAGVDPDINFETTVFDWTRPDDADSLEIADALTRLEVGRISPILESGKKLLLVRVLERQADDAEPAIE